MVRRLVVAAVVLAACLSEAGPAKAEQDPVYIPRSGTIALRLNASTTGLPFVPVEMRQEPVWSGSGDVVIHGGPGSMKCGMAGVSWGWVGSESGSVTAACSGLFGFTPRFQCPLTFFRVGTAVSLVGECTMYTQTRSIPLSAEGELVWVPGQTSGSVGTYTLVGELSVVDTTMGN